jgi:hypothetical protein
VGETFDAFDVRLSRFVVGIDLGTTNCAVAFVDTQLSIDSPLKCFPLVQWVDLSVQEPRELLPSFHYQPAAEEIKLLEGETSIVGVLARNRSEQLPGRVISSAKSWLCHAGVDRTSPILPWQSDAEVEKFSPVAACSCYLNWIRRCWDKAHPDFPLSEQEVVLTLPASFDQVARQLTIEAAKQAGLTNVVPIEEPQAAFYAWLYRNEKIWEEMVKPAQTILVCDIGGGTTDFTLIRVRQARQQGTTNDGTLNSTADSEQMGTSDPFIAASKVQSDNKATRLTLHRVAVGSHLILGGDNIDVALAKLLEAKLTGGSQLPTRSWDALVAACRSAKESLLGAFSPACYTIHLPGTGSRLIAGGQQVSLDRREVEQVVLDGFFPFSDLRQRPIEGKAGFQEFGLPYSEDAAVTHHLAAFLWDHRAAGRTDEERSVLDDLSQARPDWILFNGGVMSSHQLTERIIAVVSRWFADQSASDWQLRVLESQRLDLAVAMGAAYFGKVNRGDGVRIEAKLACSYYLQVNSDPPRAVCVVPGTASPGDQFHLQESMELMVGQPVQFPILFSSTRLADQVGDFVDLNSEEFSRLPPIRTVLNLAGSKRRRLIHVRLSAELSQIGTLQMWCAMSDGTQRWRLEYDIRGSNRSEISNQEAVANQLGLLEESAEISVREKLEQTFGSGQTSIDPSKLVPEISQALALPRHQWPPNVLRSIWQSLIEMADGRKRSPEHESRWLNLLGYALRPGYGMAADDWRVAETWRCVHGNLHFNAPDSKREARILWRRIAGGFTAGQQLTVYQQIAGPLRQIMDPARRSKGGGKTGSVSPSELIELLRLVGALELLPKSIKSQLGSWAIELLKVKKYQNCHSALCWCLARLGARQPTYGPLNCVVDTEVVTEWLNRLLQTEVADPAFNLALMQCARKVGDRYRDVEDNIRRNVISKLQYRQAAAHYIQLVSEGGQLVQQDTEDVLGDALPLGLSLLG